MHFGIKCILLVCLTSVDASIKILLTDTPVKKIGSRIYKEELITDEFQDPKELAYDSDSRNLFFMYMDDELQNSGRAFINVIFKDAKKIKGIEKNKATAVDPDTSDVYFGTENGLYKYDPLANEATSIGLYNVNVFKIVIRNNEMYVIDANNHMIYKVFDEGTRVVKVGDMKTVINFDVDNDKNIHFVSICGLYCVAGGEVVKNKDLDVVYHFIVQGNKTFGVTTDGIYDLNCVNGTAKRVARIDFFPRSIIFGDYGDIYYSIDDSIYRLKPVPSYLMYNIGKWNNNTRNKLP